jgi:hypothetical protein
MCVLERGLDLPADAQVLHQDEIPRLHEADARRVMGGAEDALEHGLRDRVG